MIQIFKNICITTLLIFSITGCDIEEEDKDTSQVNIDKNDNENMIWDKSNWDNSNWQ